MSSSSTTTTPDDSATAAAAATTSLLPPLADRIKARVQERESWLTMHTHTPGEIFKFLTKDAIIIPKSLSQQELDKVFPVQSMDWEKISKPSSAAQVTWIGHATCLVQMTNDFTILTDPVFSERCSASQLIGPKRYRPTPCTIPELLDRVAVNVVVISHNHYDHLDYNSIKDLANMSKSPITFVVPLGVKAWFDAYIANLNGEPHTVIEIDWHETHTVTAPSSSGNQQNSHNNNTLDITAVPMQHWTSRLGWDRDKTLWCGYSLVCKDSNQATQSKILFPGDTAWFEGLKDIGEQYGPFDVAMIPIGAYEPRDFMKYQHTNPEDAVKMLVDVKALKGLPIHWGTFQLTSEPVMEPRERLAKALQDEGLPQERFPSWLIGETVVYDKNESI